MSEVTSNSKPADEIRVEPDTLRKIGLTCSFSRLGRGVRSMSRIYESHMSEVGLRPTQAMMMFAIAATSGASIGELADALFLDPTTLNRNLKPLVAAGYVEIIPGEDRRKKGVFITDEGRQIVARLVPLWEAAQEEIEAKLGSDWTTRLASVLTPLEKAGGWDRSKIEEIRAAN